MFVNLTEVLTNEDRVVSMQTETGITEISVGGEKFPVLASSPVSFVLQTRERAGHGLREKRILSSRRAVTDV